MEKRALDSAGLKVSALGWLHGHGININCGQPEGRQEMIDRPARSTGLTSFPGTHSRRASSRGRSPPPRLSPAPTSGAGFLASQP